MDTSVLSFPLHILYLTNAKVLANRSSCLLGKERVGVVDWLPACWT